MNFKLLLKDKQLLSILHNVLVNNTTKNKISNVSINKESYSYNQYSLLIVMDIIIKYKIILKSDEYNEYFLDKLENITNDYNSHQDLIIKGNSLLIDLVSKKLNLNTNETLCKRAIIRYIYNKYIVDGYCFHSFPSVFKSKTEEDGLTGDIDIKEINDLKKINYIFTNHNYSNIISRNLKESNRAIYITDSPAMAYYYAFRSPEYMAELTSLSKYYKYIKDYDENAFYEKDYQKCKSNLASLCRHINMTTKEETTILKTFDKRWHSLNLSDSYPCIAFIKRSELAKDFLPNIDDIINSVDSIDLNILVSKVLDSKYPVIRRYSNIDSLSLTVITMPSYKEIRNNEFNNKVQKTTKREKRVKEREIKEKPAQNDKTIESNGKDSTTILVITGLSLGIFVLLVVIIYKLIGG